MESRHNPLRRDFIPPYIQLFRTQLTEVHMKRLLLLLLIAPLGCSPYTRAQQQLVTESRRGVALLSQSIDSHEQLSTQLLTLRHQKLDAAFDADAAKQAPITPEWLIEA